MIVWPGLRRSVSAIQRLFNSASFSATLTHSLVAERGTGSPTFTRAATATVRDNEGVLRTAISGEARFEGARRVRNWIQSPTENWANAGWVKTSMTVSGNRLTATGANASIYDSLALGMGTGRTALASITLSRVTGTGNIDISTNGGTTWTTVSVTGARVSVSLTGNINGQLAIRIVTSGDAIDATYPQLEDITGRADQTTPSEYVSVGVESAPYYHGSMVDGVKCFATDIDGAAIPSSYTYDAVSLNGVAGTYVSTPDSVANSITGDIDLRYYGPLNDWTPSTVQALINKDNAVGGNRSFEFYVTTAAKFEFAYTNNGTSFAGRIATSSVANTLTDGSAYWARVTYNVTTGKVNFYTSSDGTTWTALGTEQTITAGAIYDGTSPIEIGSYALGTAGMLSGKCLQAQIYNGIRESGGTLAVDFDASRYAGGTTLTGSTGETWTLQGNAKIHATNQPNLGYLAEGARTNLCLQSNAFTTTWIQSGTPTITQNVVGPDGTTSAWTITDNDAGFNEAVYQPITLTAATYTASVFIQKTSGATTFPILYSLNGAGTIIAPVTVDTNNGIATAWTAYTGFTIASGLVARCTSYNDNFWRVSYSFTATAEVWSQALALSPAGTTNSTQSTGTLNVALSGSAVFYGAQVELGSSASSYIPTTTAAVARNADVLTYPSAGNISTVAGWAYAEVVSNVPAGTQIDMIDLVASGNPFIPMLVNAGNNFALLDPSVNTRAFNAMTPRPFTTPVDFVSTWGASGTTGTYNGAAPPALQTYTTGAVTNPISVGIRSDGTVGTFGTIRNVRIGQRQLSSSELQAVTS